jgi:cellulose synthase/poly-beta-1,6-N-acetylglucosamine synthase-like glycosyltransferase
MIIIPVVAALLIIFLITIYIFNKGIEKAFSFSSSESSNLKVSVIIAAKNEERNIEKLISAIDEQDYPKDHYEVIIVDDNSKDSTYARTKSMISDNQRFKILQNDDSGLPPKKGALEIGIRNAQHEFILITDADCTPLPGWIGAFVNKFRDGYDFIFGIAPYHQSKYSDVNSFACFENLRTSLLTFSAAALGFPFSASARSFGFKKESFNKIGGYKSTLHSMGGDDDLLLQEAVKNNMSVGVVTDRKGFVYSDAPFTFKEYSQQKKRHTKTSHHYLFKNKILISYWHIINLLFLFSLLLIPFSVYFSALFITKMICDFMIIKKRQSELAYNFNDYEILLLQFLYELMIIYNFINSFTKLKRWK